jgi:DNA primase
MGSTQKALSRKLGQFANALVSAEEYKNDINPLLVETLKGIYDGEGYERAKRSNDNQTHTTSVLSSLILTGQQLPTRENALFSRCNLLEFAQSEFTQEEVQKFEKLRRIQEDGLTHLTGQLFKHYALVRSSFQRTFSEVDHQLRIRFAGRTIADRIVNNYSSILTPCLVLQRAGIFDLSFLKFDTMREIENTIAGQVEHLNATTEINQFWYVLKLLIEKNDAMLEGVHYIFRKDKTTGRTCIGIRFQSVADFYRDYSLKRRQPNILDERSLSAYLKQDKAFVPGNYNGGCHYVNVGGVKKSFFFFDMNNLPGDMHELMPDTKESKISNITN